MAVRSCRMLVSGFAVFVGRCSVAFGFVVLALRMVMSRLVVMMSGGLMRSSSIVVVLAGRMLGSDSV